MQKSWGRSSVDDREDGGLAILDQGFLLSQDIPQVVKGAAARWDYLMR